VSDQFGFDRGKPIDRYYIEKFLSANAGLIRNDVLEIGEDTYTRAFGAAGHRSSVLSFDKNDGKGRYGDLCERSTLTENSVDCFICTQTFNFIYDFESAIEGARFLLKPGGVLLATVAALAPVSKYDAERWGDYWRFTPQSAERIFGDVFGKEKVSTSVYGNSGIAALFIKGYALEDIGGEAELDMGDPLYPVVIGIKAVK
jgi:hypothetical protein